MKLKTALILMICLQLLFCATSQTKLEKAREKDPRYQYNMGLFYLNSSQLDLSINHLKKSLSLDPKNYLAFNALGLAYSLKGDLKEAVKYYTECIRLNPSLSEAHNNLGSVYQEMELYDKAEEEFLAASLDTQYSSRELPFYNLARLYVIQEKTQEALFQVQKALEMKPDFVLALNLRGKIYVQLDQLDRAIASFEEAKEMDPNDVNLNYNLAEAYFKNRQFQKAKQLFNAIYLKVTDPEMKKRIEEYLAEIKLPGV
ncbi:MAG: tetratricopeptide repeat protein [Candidatus Aminicenantes bacterium]|jgi:Tfp pilus assembly protein PilF